MAGRDVYLCSSDMDETELRVWVQNNPGRINIIDVYRKTCLFMAICFNSVSLLLWVGEGERCGRERR